MKTIGTVRSLALLAGVFLTSLSAQTVETIAYRAILSGANEVPAVANTSGTATVWLHVVRDASGNITSGSADAYVNYSLGGAATITAMHIHNGAAGVNGPLSWASALPEPSTPQALAHSRPSRHSSRRPASLSTP